MSVVRFGFAPGLRRRLRLEAARALAQLPETARVTVMSRLGSSSGCSCANYVLIDCGICYDESQLLSSVMNSEDHMGEFMNSHISGQLVLMCREGSTLAAMDASSRESSLLRACGVAQTDRPEAGPWRRAGWGSGGPPPDLYIVYCMIVYIHTNLLYSVIHTACTVRSL